MCDGYSSDNQRIFRGERQGQAMSNQTVLYNHDHKDLGWLGVGNRSQVHYWRSVTSSGLAMSHCGMIVLKRDMHNDGEQAMCGECEMIEQMRDEIEHRKQSGGSLDK